MVQEWQYHLSLESEERNAGLLGGMDYYQLGLPVVADSVASDGSGVLTRVAGDCKFVFSSIEHITRRLNLPYTTPVHACNRYGALCLGLVFPHFDQWRETVTACIKLQPWDCSKGGDGENVSALIGVLYQNPR